MLAEQALEALHLHGHGKLAKRLPILEYWELDGCDPSLRERPENDFISDDHPSLMRRRVAGLQRQSDCAWAMVGPVSSRY